jgi:site-specific recombinase XerD
MNLKRAIRKYVYINRYQKLLSPRTIQFQLGCLDKMALSLPGVEIEEIKYCDIQQYLDSLKARKLAKATIRGRYSVIMAFLNHYYKAKVIGFNPYYWVIKVAKYRAHKEPLNERLLKRILQAKCNYRVKTQFQYYRNLTILGFLIYGGLRVSEIRCLELSEVDLNSKYLKIKRGKFNLDRIVPIEEPLVGWIKEYMNYRPKCRSKQLIVGMFDKRRMDRGAINIIVKKHARAAGIKRKVYSHILRHSFASQMLKGGADLDNLKLLMGHKDIEMTAMYAKPDFSMIKEGLGRNPLIEYYRGEAKNGK